MEDPMKALTTLATFMVATFLGLGLVGCGSDPTGGNSNSAVTGDGGPSGGDIVQGSDAGSDAGADTNSAGDNGAESDSAQDAEVTKTCPPKDRPDAVISVKVQSGIVCVANEDEAQWPKLIDGRTWRYVKNCGTIDSSLCEVKTFFHDAEFMPTGEGWGEGVKPKNFVGKQILQLNQYGYSAQTSYNANSSEYVTPPHIGYFAKTKIEKVNGDLLLKLWGHKIETNEDIYYFEYKVL